MHLPAIPPANVPCPAWQAPPRGPVQLLADVQCRAPPSTLPSLFGRAALERRTRVRALGSALGRWGRKGRFGGTLEVKGHMKFCMPVLMQRCVRSIGGWQ